MSIKLGQLATLRSGVTVRNRVIDDPKGKYHLIQFRDIDRATYSITGSTPMDGSAYANKHLLQEGDLLFTAKGAYNNAFLFRNQYPNALAASIFTVIRVVPQLILPGYLAWYINSPAAQHALERLKGGSAIPSINSKDLRDLPIPLPSLDKQRSIAELVDLLEREEALHLQLIQEKKRLVNQVIYDVI